MSEFYPVQDLETMKLAWQILPAIVAGFDFLEDAGFDCFGIANENPFNNGK